MKAIVLTLLLILGTTILKSQNQESLEVLLKKRDALVEKKQSTREIDYKLIKTYAYSPKVIAVKQSSVGYKFDTYLPMKESAIEHFKQRLLNSFKIKSVEVDPKKKVAQVEFKAEATEIDQINFFKAFGYEGIIYQ